MTDVLVHSRLTQIIEAMEKMHNGLLAIIDAHHELQERVNKLEGEFKELKDRLTE